MTTYKFTTDAALKSAIASQFPNVRIRKCNEWNVWQLVYVASGNNAEWTYCHNEIDAAHDSHSKACARLDAYCMAQSMQGNA